MKDENSKGSGYGGAGEGKEETAQLCVELVSNSVLSQGLDLFVPVGLIQPHI